MTVEDRRGAYISGLEQEAFTVLEDGKPQAVQFFSAADTPATIGLLIDNSYSMMNRRELVVAAAIGFTERSNPEDEVFVLAFNENVGEIWAPKIIRDTNLLSMKAVLLGNIAARGKTALYDAIAGGLDRLNAGKHTRQVLVIVSDGSDNASATTLDEVLDPDAFRRGGDLHGDPARSDRSRGQCRPAQAPRDGDRRRGVRARADGRRAEDARAHRARHSQRLHDRLRAGQARTAIRRCAS